MNGELSGLPEITQIRNRDEILSPATTCFMTTFKEAIQMQREFIYPEPADFGLSSENLVSMFDETPHLKFTGCGV